MDQFREPVTEGLGNGPATQDASESRSERRRVRRSSSSGQPTSRHELWARIASLRKQRLYLSLAIAGLLAVCCFAFYVAYHANATLSDSRALLAEERSTFESRLQDSETQLSGAREELAAAQASIAVLVEKRIPGLRPLKTDEVIAIGDRGIRDVAFTALRESDGHGYEAKVVIENAGPAPATPALNVVLFDLTGVEIGRSRVGLESDGKPSRLRPGEIRSYFAVVKLEPGRDAAYFRLDAIVDKQG